MPKVTNEYTNEVATRKPKAGDIYYYADGDSFSEGFYMVATVGYMNSPGSHRALISLEDGNRWNDAVHKDEFEVPPEFEYIENPQIIVQRSV